ncbi:carbon-nitrogen hydrolase family protein [Thauera sp.]|uniref:carbon-nitrogen hydrolase family protein n=1 Tax=Thauera sp. TaxID=1905334 RepID=UPI0039E2B41C
MTETLTIALGQYAPAPDLAANLATIAGLAADAQRGGAQWLLLPEYASCLDGRRSVMLEAAYQAERVQREVARVAEQSGLWIFLGSHVVYDASAKQMANRSLVFDRRGQVRAAYDKLHMFDVTLADGTQIQESRHYRPGNRAVVLATPWCKVGLSVCYDVRFPHFYRSLAQAGAEVLLVPAAFTRQTGPGHWRTLLQARAIENRAFVLATAACGESGNGRTSYGHSLVIDPDGVVLAELDGEPGLLIQSISLGDVAKRRQQLPSLQHDRPFSIQSLNATQEVES